MFKHLVGLQMLISWTCHPWCRGNACGKDAHVHCCCSESDMVKQPRIGKGLDMLWHLWPLTAPWPDGPWLVTCRPGFCWSFGASRTSRFGYRCVRWRRPRSDAVYLIFSWMFFLMFLFFEVQNRTSGNVRNVQGFFCAWMWPQIFAVRLAQKFFAEAGQPTGVLWRQ